MTSPRSPDRAAAAVIQVRGAVKRYGATRALDGVDFELRAGEVVAVCGLNGAGKSTLAGVLGGAVQLDAGELHVDGEPVVLRSPREAAALGIATVHQELAYLPGRSAEDNILLNVWPTRFGFVRPRASRALARATTRRLGHDFDWERPVGQMSVADRQIVEIARALARNARVLLLDEPTAALGQQDVARLLGVIRALADEGVACVLITHRLNEIWTVADRIVAIRDGGVVLAGSVGELEREAVVRSFSETSVNAPQREQIQTHALRDMSAERRQEPGVVEVRDAAAHGHPPLDGIGFAARRGQLVVIYGAPGSGAETLAQLLAGRRPDARGSIRLAGTDAPMPRTPRAALKLGIASVPSDRKHDGLILGMSVAANISLTTLARRTRFGLVKRRAEAELAQDWRERLTIKYGHADDPVSSLSGGNQQKILLTSRLAMHPRMLVLHEPTRGVDVLSRAQIHTMLQAIADQMAVVVITSDFDEAALLSEDYLTLEHGALRSRQDPTGAAIGPVARTV